MPTSSKLLFLCCGSFRLKNNQLITKARMVLAESQNQAYEAFVGIIQHFNKSAALQPGYSITEIPRKQLETWLEATYVET